MSCRRILWFTGREGKWMKTVEIMPAGDGSKGIPGENIKDVAQ